MPEMVQTFKSMQKTESEKRKFLASIQGIELNDNSSNNEEDLPSKISNVGHLE